MRIESFIEFMESLAPPELALPGDRIGYHGPEIEVESVLLLMDYLEDVPVDGYDLLVLHHPPQVEPPLPYYVAHSNWDVADGGACDALADALGLDVESFLDPETGLGRICHGDITLEELMERIHDLMPGVVRVVNPREYLDRVAVVAGFGLSDRDLIRMAFSEGAHVYLSGDLTHASAVLARNLNMTLIDAGHHATEMPGLLRLLDMIEDLGLMVDLIDTGTPWTEYRYETF
ncbi:Nif3-like dinuclear metal center hexameric protein [Methanothermobacter sp.]|uniref:Nif3-like dinuclear metal center hexameric protein n=1 Tax=Methanothermobacter sp. TaxID=1884223 RepID=UPI00262FEDE9|nr:Nif3-like dinuclear metal center hexameric protein [Methanothermobacter sp.]MDI9614925.1 Nif3-like dinuclear metal center hexameric protein [Methanothermobacter sp.]